MAKNKMTECKVCGQMIAKSAKACPSCGAKIKKTHPILGIIGILLLLNGWLNIFGGSTPDNIKTSYVLGEMAEMNNICVTMVDVREDKGSTYNKPTSGNIYVLCEFEIANNSDKEIAVSSMMSFEAYCDDYTCTYSLNALMESGNKSQLDGVVAPGKKFNGVIGYEVPKEWQKLEVVFTPDFWSGKEMTFIATK